MHPEKGPAVEHTAGPEECGLFVAGEVGDAVKALLQVGVGGDAVGHLAVVEQWVRANERHPETYVSRCCFLAGAGGLREPRRKGARVAAPSGCIVPWAARASCWPQPQQLLPVSAAGSGRRCCTGAFFPAGLFGGSMLFSSTLVVRYKVQIKQKLQRHNNAGVLGGRGWIRTTEAESSRFTVCPHWPLGNTPIFFCVRRTDCLYILPRAKQFVNHLQQILSQFLHQSLQQTLPMEKPPGNQCSRAVFLGAGDRS